MKLNPLPCTHAPRVERRKTPVGRSLFLAVLPWSLPVQRRFHDLLICCSIEKAVQESMYSWFSVSFANKGKWAFISSGKDAFWRLYPMRVWRTVSRMSLFWDWAQDFTCAKCRIYQTQSSLALREFLYQRAALQNAGCISLSRIFETESHCVAQPGFKFVMRLLSWFPRWQMYAATHGF